MTRVLTAFLLVILLKPVSYGQGVQPAPVFKNGSLNDRNSLLNLRLSHPLWQATRFEDNYFVLVQMDGIASPIQKSDLANHGIILAQYLSGNNWFATCKPGFSLKNPGEMGIKNIYAIPAALKVDARLMEHIDQFKGPKDLIAITCFPMDKKRIENALRESGAQIMETKIKPAHVWFVRATSATIEKLALLPFISSISPLHLEDIPLNYNNRAIHSVQSLSATIGRNLTGKNLIVGIGDNADPST